jgi:heat shock protein HslJ
MIEHINWQLVEVGGRPAEPLPADSKPAHLRLNSADKRISGYSSINQFGGTYELRGNLLKLGPLAMTRRAGPASLMQQESAFTQAMQSTTSWRAAGNDIELLDASGKPLARLSRAGN